MPHIYRSKSVLVEAGHVKVDNVERVAEWCGGQVVYDPAAIAIPTREGVMFANVGDYVVKEPFPTEDRKFYPVKADIFAQRYTLADDTRERALVLDWLEAERVAHQDVKFADFRDENDRWLREERGVNEDSEWWRQLTQYIGRARLLGLDTLAGRQAVLKFVATALGLAESLVRESGALEARHALPAPGVPSGELRPWNEHA